MPDPLSADDARNAALRAQALLAPPPRRPSVHATLRRLGAVQLDTIAVLARSHELVACARLGAVGRAAIERAYWGAPTRAFEYYAHAACLLPVDMWPHFAFRRRALAARRPRHPVSPRVLNDVRARLRDGPVTAGDLGGARNGPGGWWSWSDAKLALEALYMRGEAAVTTRRAWRRVYDLPERAIPRHLLDSEPSDADCVRQLVAAAARALGVATRRDITEYFRITWPVSTRPDGIHDLVDDAISDAGLIPVDVEGWSEPAWASPPALRPARGEQHRTTLLSPFDSLIWDRARTARLFGFTISLEAYKPKHQRVHGYFALPVLAGGRLVARVDTARDGATLVARHAVIDDPAAAADVAAALREAAAWVNCTAVRIQRVTPARLTSPLRTATR